MSLFDVIKYKNYDLTTESGLQALPVELLDLYTAKMCLLVYGNTDNDPFLLSILPQWAKYDIASIHSVKLAEWCRIKFDEALKEYNDDDFPCS
jgi:hypothetical protein